MRLDGFSMSGNLYFFHLWSISKRAQAHVRQDERLAERTRIAQALHDTVLQTFLSAFLQLHVAVDQLPANSPAKLQLSKVLELMERVSEEFRRSVRGLRFSGEESNDLEQSFSSIPQELGLQQRTTVRVLVLGSPRLLNPAVREEIYHIGREALMNALRHSHASRVEVELEYAAKRFRLVVRDDGCGIGPEVCAPDARDIGASRACASAPKKLAEDSKSGAVLRPERRSSSPSPIQSLSSLQTDDLRARSELSRCDIF